MALTPGEGDVGGGSLGGTAGSICAISPSDLVGTIGNLITRIENLEFQLSQVVGANLHTESLDNISEQVGWVYGVEYMGTPGWIMTPAGTLIPPPGFSFLGSGLTLSDGNTYNAVMMDSDGVLQYGFQTDGQISGASWPGVAYGMFASEGAYGGTNANPDQVYFKGATRLTQQFSTATSGSPIVRTETWRVDSAGLYLVSMTGGSQISGNDLGIMATLTMTALAINDGSNQLDHVYHDVKDYDLFGNGYTVTGSFSVPWRANAGDTISLSFSHGRSAAVGVVSTFHASTEIASVIKVGTLT